MAKEIKQEDVDVVEDTIEDTIEDVSQVKTDTPKKDEEVTLSKAAFDEMMLRIAGLEKSQKEIESVQDQKQQDKIERMRREGKLVKDVKVRKVENQIVIGWKTLMDEVYFADGKLIENQKVEIWLEDGKKLELTQRQWASLPVYQKMEVKKESRDENGEISYTLLGSDGKELEISTKYIN